MIAAAGSGHKRYSGAGFQIMVDSSNVVLSVLEPGLDKQKLRSFFQSHFLPFDEAAIQAALATGPGSSSVIVENLAKVKKDAALHLRLAADHMHAYGRVVPPFWGKPLAAAAVIRQLAAAGVVYGIREKEILALVAEQMYEGEWILAQGLAVQNGLPGRLDYQPAMQKSSGKPTFLADGRVDLRELDNIVEVKAGTVLAVKIPPTAGTAGRTVLGQEVAPTPGRDLAWPLGKGVEVETDKLVASITGQVMIKAGRVHVLPVHEVSGDVDYSTGNIRFSGNVVVRGTVKPGFVVETEGDFSVAKSISSARVHCGGTLKVAGGIQGQGRGVIEAQGDVVARFIENCKVVAGGNVTVGENIMHSEIVAGASIVVGGRRGLIVGGSVRARENIECKVLGASFGTATTLEVGVDPTVFEQFGQLRQEMAAAEDELNRLQQGIRRLEHLQAQNLLAPERVSMLAQLQVAFTQREAALMDMNVRWEQYEKAVADIKTAFIKVSDTIYAGVKIHMGRAVYHTRDTMQGGIFRLEKGDIVFSPS